MIYCSARRFIIGNTFSARDALALVLQSVNFIHHSLEVTKDLLSDRELGSTVAMGFITLATVNLDRVNAWKFYRFLMEHGMEYGIWPPGFSLVQAGAQMFVSYICRTPTGRWMKEDDEQVQWMKQPVVHRGYVFDCESMVHGPLQRLQFCEDVMRSELLRNPNLVFEKAPLTFFVLELSPNVSEEFSLLDLFKRTSLTPVLEDILREAGMDPDMVYEEMERRESTGMSVEASSNDAPKPAGLKERLAVKRRRGYQNEE